MTVSTLLLSLAQVAAAGAVLAAVAFVAMQRQKKLAKVSVRKTPRAVRPYR
jgi:hypothetical protein